MSHERKKSVILDDYVVFFQEHEKNNGMMEDYPINFHLAMQDSNSKKWIEEMNEVYKSI